MEFQDNVTMIEMLQDFISTDLESYFKKSSLKMRLWNNHLSTYSIPFAKQVTYASITSNASSPEQELILTWTERDLPLSSLQENS